jgi:C4-dicarboxylate-specific signal transduction histidine kinase
MDKPGMSRLEAVIETVHPDDAAKFRDNLRRCLVTGERFSMEYRLRRADGVYRWMSGRAEPLRDQDGRIVQWFGLCHDIDDQMHAEDALRRASDKLAQATQAASLAELSASIAHEVNQPLAAIVANANACHRWLSAAPPNLDRAKITAERIIRDANSAADVVSRIRALFKQSEEPRNYAAFDGVIVEAHKFMAEEAVRRNVRMDIDVESNLPLLAFDRVQIQQVLINLMRNAFEAMDSVAGEKVLRMRARRIGDVVQTEISDRGGGIESPEKIFDPFVTTKRDGMGMGLAICRSIVESHGGRLWAERNEPQGAKFIFTLPVESKAAP